MIAGVTTWSFAAMAHGWAMAAWQVVGARIGLGATEAVQTPLTIKTVATLFPPDKRSFRLRRRYRDRWIGYDQPALFHTHDLQPTSGLAWGIGIWRGGRVCHSSFVVVVCPRYHVSMTWRGR